jgi:DNA helicase-2/ATP-dependent DNA helicase PcrA
VDLTQLNEQQRKAVTHPGGPVLVTAGPGSGKCVVGDTLVLTELGLLSMNELGEFLGTPPVDETTSCDIIVASLSQDCRANVFYNGGVSEVQEVVLASGVRISGTNEHPLMVMNEAGEYEFKPLSDISVGDYVCIARGQMMFGSTTTLPKPERAYERLHLPETINEEMANALGWIVAEGDFGGGSLGFTGTEIRCCWIAEKVERFFGIPCCGPRRDERRQNTWQVEFCSVELIDYLAYIGIYGLSRDKQIPTCIRMAPQNIVKAFLVGLFDGDGTASSTRNVVEYASASEILVRQLHSMLLNFGIVGFILPKEVDGVTYWRLIVSGEDAIKFGELIGFSIEEKQCRVANSNSSYHNTNTDIIPHIQRQLKQLILLNGDLGLGLDWRGEAGKLLYAAKQRYNGIKNVTYYFMQRILELYKDASEHETYQYLSSVASRYYYYDSVRSVTPAGKQQVFDLTVPKSHAYIANGIVNHNTRVLTHRVACLIEQGIPADRLLLLTFTNKAADEMVERIKHLTGAQVQGKWMGTFHSICVKLLRNQGLKFVIVDERDRQDLMRSAMERVDIDPNQISPTPIIDAISIMKNELIGVRDYLLDPVRYAGQFGYETYQDFISSAWPKYEEIKQEQNGLDFDDLLYETVVMLAHHPNIADYYREWFQHILVDEMQDTNRAQSELITLLTGEHRNVFVVGDADQSIFCWRGADFRNIMNFTDTFPDAEYIQLGQNYRSTSSIVQASASLIEHNVERFDVDLFTANDTGHPIQLWHCFNADDESARIVQEIVRLHSQGVKYSDIAILYRINALSADMEAALRTTGIPYQVVGAYKFFDRKEIRDFIAYAKFAINPVDGLHLGRVVNTPKRGLGEKTLEAVRDFAFSKGVGLLEVLEDPTLRDVVTKPAYRGLMDFAQVTNELVRYVNKPSAFFQGVINLTNYASHLRSQYDESAAKDRMDNIQALINVAAKWEESNDGGLDDFLIYVSLLSDADDRNDNDTVKLMTIHAAKGLEFDSVFVRAVEDGTIPHVRSSTPEGREEERRLLYVAMTRAKRLLHLTHCSFRRVWGKEARMEPSPFLLEIPDEFIREC